MTAIIPLKSLSEAKGRLAGELDPQERRAITGWMARRVIEACVACAGISDILLVAGDDAGAALGGPDVRTLVVPRPGLAVALHEADRAAAGAEATMVVAADLPALTADDLDAVIAAGHGENHVVVVAPTTDGGTGALLRRPAGLIATAYGPGSAARHAALAADAGIRVAVVNRPGLATDVDTPDQLRTALALAAEQDVGCAPR